MTIITVSQLNIYLKSVFEELPILQNIYITGEISNFKHYYQSGHMYFTLKDATSQIKCVMFSNDNYKLKFIPENGMNVLCFGQVGVYERDGAYQLYVRDMQPKGVGELTVAYEQLKLKLENEDLFNEDNKKPIPKFPSRIGVATSNVGAAVEDIKNIISRRYPLCEIFIKSTVVQGENAPDSIVNSIKYLDDMKLDVIIVGRGGGSLEDLWAFNTEKVARAVYKCRTPVISAVGHETDYTICDFVADKRASTPSAAAELCVPDIKYEYDRINNVKGSLDLLINRRVEGERARLNAIKNSLALSNTSNLIDKMQDRIDNYNYQMSISINNALITKQNEIKKYASMLNALSPLAILSRGYSIVSNKDSVVSSINDVDIDDSVVIRLNDGNVSARIIEVNKYE